MSINPYEPPATTDQLHADAATGNVLAGRSSRFVAALIDGLAMMVVVIPIQFFTGYYQRAQEPGPSPLEQILMSLFGMVVFLVINGQLLRTRGQTLGKWLTGIQIVDHLTATIPPFVRVYVYRYLWSFPLIIVAALVPGNIDDMLVNLVILVDVLFIFGSNRRCIHDYIAGTKVVLFRQG